MRHRPASVIVVGVGTAGSVLAARLSERRDRSVTLLEAGPGDDADDADDATILEPALAAGMWTDSPPMAATPMANGTTAISGFQGRILGGTSAGRRRGHHLSHGGVPVAIERRGSVRARPDPP